MINKNLFLFYGGVISLAILFLLFAVRLYQPLLLDIDAKWLVLAGLPVLIALFTAGYISKFKGFGMEIEAMVRKEIRYDESILTVVNKIKAQNKQSPAVLNDMSDEDKRRYNVLSFIAGHPDYYNPHAIMEYVRHLPNIFFFEVKDSNDNFLALIKIDRRLFKTDQNYTYVSDLIDRIEQNFISEKNTPFNISQQFVFSSVSIIETLKKIRSTNKDFIAVLDSREKPVLIGIAFESRIEKQLANIVIRSMEEN